MNRLTICFLFSVCLFTGLRAEDGYRLWLRYDPIPDRALSRDYASAAKHIVLSTPTGVFSPTLVVARNELITGLRGLLGVEVLITTEKLSDENPALGKEGFALSQKDQDSLLIAANSDMGALYGSYALLRQVQTQQPVKALNLTSSPKIQCRLLNHWDNLDRSIERGYAGFSLWDWFTLPEYRDPRYRDYARACASLGINGAVLNNVNANARILSPFFLAKVAALAEEFRPYGIRVYLSARFSAPMELGGLKTADPLSPEVAAWWRAKIDEIYQAIPDFGGFLVKANSEGQPGPQDYKRTHADGANMLADALAPHGGIVMWRAFVYKAEVNEDRAKQAYNEFKPLDGQFRPNVVVQIKNGPIDFMPREPFSPLFAVMPKTALSLELQITQEYLGQGTQLAYLGTMWKEVLDADSYAKGPGSSIARIIEGKLTPQTLTVIAGVANTGTDRNWTGHPLSQSNWYAFGRLAWDPSLFAASIADEWTRMTFGNDPKVVSTLTKVLLGSRETVVNYSMPLGLHHLMATGHHYGPGPWVGSLGRPDWNPTYYHRADAEGLGFERTSKGSGALDQYAPEIVRNWGDLASCPDELLLWFHHVPWTYRMRSGNTLWDELCLRYRRGVDEVHVMQAEWNSLARAIDADRYSHVQALFKRQERDARDWRDACLLYFQEFSKLPLPAGVEKPAHPLDYYKAIDVRPAPGHDGK